LRQNDKICDCFVPILGLQSLFQPTIPAYSTMIVCSPQVKCLCWSIV
jgi:hypothetical protein